MRAPVFAKLIFFFFEARIVLRHVDTTMLCVHKLRILLCSFGTYDISNRLNTVFFLSFFFLHAVVAGRANKNTRDERCSFASLHQGIETRVAHTKITENKKCHRQRDTFTFCLSISVVFASHTRQTIFFHQTHTMLC